MIHINQINAGLGLGLTTEFVSDTLGVKPSAPDQWEATDFSCICGLLIAHIYKNAGAVHSAPGGTPTTVANSDFF